MPPLAVLASIDTLSGASADARETLSPRRLSGWGIHSLTPSPLPSPPFLLSCASRHASAAPDCLIGTFHVSGWTSQDRAPRQWYTCFSSCRCSCPPFLCLSFCSYSSVQCTPRGISRRSWGNLKTRRWEKGRRKKSMTNNSLAGTRREKRGRTRLCASHRIDLHPRPSLWVDSGVTRKYNKVIEWVEKTPGHY